MIEFVISPLVDRISKKDYNELFQMEYRGSVRSERLAGAKARRASPGVV